MKKILLVFGTRPEALKLAPLILELQKYPSLFEIRVCITSQHKKMLEQVLLEFNIKADYDLNIMKQNQDLFDITSNIILKLKNMLTEYIPDLVIVHGDTTTTLVASLAAFYKRIPVAHIEAGLRTNDKYSPWPEEINRQLTSKIAEYHFAPTQGSKNNLLLENIQSDKIFVTGNTIIDTLLLSVNKIKNSKEFQFELAKQLSVNNYNLDRNRKIILITGHRRENFGDGFLNICNAIKELSIQHPEVDFVYPVHLNPNVRKPVNKILSNSNNIFLIEPLDYFPFVYLMINCYLILTDSGGIQEEAPSLGKPVLVMRNTTERPEAVQQGTVVLVGTDKNKIIKIVNLLINNNNEYSKMSEAINPYGDGLASLNICNIIKNKLLEK